MIPATIFLLLSTQTVTVSTTEEFRQAVGGAKPGSTVLVKPGRYRGGLHFSELHGQPGRPVRIQGSDAANPPVFDGGGSALQFSAVSHLHISNLVLKGAQGNGLNIDDGGNYEKPSHHVEIRNIVVSDLPAGNHDGIKLSGIDNFLVKGCRIERWGGSGVDMVGCHDGVIEGCTFQSGGDSGIQAKGGTARVAIRQCTFSDYGQRGVNIGGSTGPEFFRPPLSKMPPQQKYEAKAIDVEGCVFSGGAAPLAFVGVDGSRVRYNTIYHPERWAMRILQETTDPGFVACRNGLFERNLVVFRSDKWFEGGVNIGPNTRPETFRFAENYWFCSDQPDRSAPRLPTVEKSPMVGRDPLLSSDLRSAGEPVAKKYGSHALPARV